MASGWGIKWKSNSPLGASECILGRTIKPLVFRTRSEARAYIKNNYSYIRYRKDLRSPPHCWTVPKAVKVIVEVREDV
jgi:hypothetical protein